MNSALNEKPTVGQIVKVRARRRTWPKDATGRSGSAVIEETVHAATVRKVGRKYVTVEWQVGRYPQSKQFDWATGSPAGEHSGNDLDRMFTAQGFESERRINAARAALTACGVMLRKDTGYGEPELTAEQWEAIAAVCVAPDSFGDGISA